QGPSGLLAGGPADGRDAGAGGGPADALGGIGGMIRPVLLGVDAVVHDPHPVRLHGGIGVEHVAPHAGGDRDDRVGRLDGGLLHPGRQGVPDAHLLDLTRSWLIMSVSVFTEYTEYARLVH